MKNAKSGAEVIGMVVISKDGTVMVKVLPGYEDIVLEQLQWAKRSIEGQETVVRVAKRKVYGTLATVLDELEGVSEKQFEAFKERMIAEHGAKMTENEVAVLRAMSKETLKSVRERKDRGEFKEFFRKKDDKEDGDE